MSRYLVDKSALARATQAAVRERLEEILSREEPITCPIVDLEMLYSTRSPGEYELWRASRHAGYESQPLTPQIGGRALEVQRLLAHGGRHRGASIPDLLIAACAEAQDAAVLHYDADYELIAEATGQPTEWVVPRGSVP